MQLKKNFKETWNKIQEFIICLQYHLVTYLGTTQIKYF